MQQNPNILKPVTRNRAILRQQNPNIYIIPPLQLAGILFIIATDRAKEGVWQQNPNFAEAERAIKPSQKPGIATKSELLKMGAGLRTLTSRWKSGK